MNVHIEHWKTYEYSTKNTNDEVLLYSALLGLLGRWMSKENDNL